MRNLENPRSAADRLISMAGEIGAEEVAVVRNPGYLFQPYELYLLAPRQTSLQRLSAAVMDMDGTTTTTETLCLHSLETMIRRATGRLDRGAWKGLDPERDYPHIIGNSTTRHVEYLVETYGADFDDARFSGSFVHAAAWTLVRGKDPGRKEEVEADLAAFGLSSSMNDPAFLALADLPEPEAVEKARRFLPEDGRLHMLRDPVNRVRAAVDVYYTRYHEILGELASGRSGEVAEEILGDPDAPLILPMPGVAIFLALLKGWLGEAAETLADRLPPDTAAPGETAAALADLGRRFARTPAKVAVVTSSIAYEAEIVLDEVFRTIRREIGDWPLDSGTREELLRRFESPAAYYDAIVTASDSSEIRLKPHRDLYALALHRLGISRSRCSEVLGLEDSESGVIAIRAAGIGLSVAVPFSDTAGHDLSAASAIMKNGLPEVMVRRRCFLAARARER